MESLEEFSKDKLKDIKKIKDDEKYMSSKKN